MSELQEREGQEAHVSSRVQVRRPLREHGLVRGVLELFISLLQHLQVGLTDSLTMTGPQKGARFLWGFLPVG